MTIDNAPADAGPGRDHEAGVHRALSSAVRQRLLRRLRMEPEPEDVITLADHLGLHVNTVRAHLAVLEDAGLVASRTEPRQGPGRPRLLYAATDEAVDAVGSQSYRFLAEVLATHLASVTADPSAEAEAAGRTFGHHFVERPGDDDIDRDTAIDRVVAMLDEFGFAPTYEAGETPRILLHQCPFVEVARDHQDVVCGVHLGLMRGALDELGVDVAVAELRPFVEPSLCVSDLVLT